MYATLLTLYTTLTDLAKTAWSNLAAEVPRVDSDDRAELLRAPDTFFKIGPQLVQDVQREASAELAEQLEPEETLTELELVAAIDRFLVVLRDIEKLSLDLRLVAVDRAWRRMTRVHQLVAVYARHNPSYASLLQKFTALYPRRSKASGQSAAAR